MSISLHGISQKFIFLQQNPKTGDEILANGESLTLTGVSKGKWDVRVVDEDGDECIIEDVAINSNDKWVIEDDDLLACQNK